VTKATTYLGTVDSDRGVYARAMSRLDRVVALAQDAGDSRREAYGRSMLGRCHPLRGELASAATQLDESIELAERSHWLALLPWPHSLLGEVQLLGGRSGAASTTLRQAFARACQLGDPCWEGTAGRGLALVAEARGETELARSGAHLQPRRLPAGPPGSKP
jgi:tetratricopeptide (TPR) repeat protein